MYYGIVKATATLYGFSDKMHVVTKEHETIDAANAEMTAKIRTLPRRTYLSMYPFDTAVVNITEISDDEKRFFTIRDGFFGVIVLLNEMQTFRVGDRYGD